MKLPNWRFLTTGITLVGLVPLLIGGFSESPKTSPYTYIGFGILLLSVIISLWKVRCPSCGHYLGGRGVTMGAKNCPYCGKPLF